MTEVDITSPVDGAEDALPATAAAKRQAEGHGSDPREGIERTVAAMGRSVRLSADMVAMALREAVRDRMLERNLSGRPGTLLVRSADVMPKRTLSWGLWALGWESAELLRGPGIGDVDEDFTWWHEEDWNERTVLDTYAYVVSERKHWSLYTVCAREGSRVPRSIEAFADVDVDLRTLVEPRHLAKAVCHRFDDAWRNSWRDAWAERAVHLLRSSYARPWVQLLDVAAAQALSFAQLAERFDVLVERAGGVPVGGGYSWLASALEREERRAMEDGISDVYFDFATARFDDDPFGTSAPEEG